MDVSMIVATIPPRVSQLVDLLESVRDQYVKPKRVLIEVDTEHEGSAAMRNRALERVDTPWVTFADDDDTLKPTHLEVLTQAQIRSGADVVYSWYDVVGGTDPRPEMFGKPFDADELRRGSFITVASLVRTSLAKQCAFEYKEGLDDWGFYLNLLDLGAIFHHEPIRTYNWLHHDYNTSGKHWKEIYSL